MVKLICECWLVSVSPCLRELARGEVAVRAVGSVFVVVDAPVLDQDLGFEQVVELPAVQEFVAEPAVEAFDPRVLPRRTGIDEHRTDVVEAAPVRDASGDELRAVVEPHERGRTAGHRDRVERRDDLVRVAVPADHDRRALAGVLVDDVQQLQRVAVCSRVELEVEPSQDVRSGRAHRTDRDAETTMRLLPLAIPLVDDVRYGRAVEPLRRAMLPDEPCTLVVGRPRTHVRELLEHTPCDHGAPVRESATSSTSKHTYGFAPITCSF